MNDGDIVELHTSKYRKAEEKTVAEWSREGQRIGWYLAYFAVSTYLSLKS